MLLATVALSSCVTYPDITQSRSPCRLEPGGWCGFVREAAVEAYPYAVAATNAYVGDADVYMVPLPTLKHQERDDLDPEDERKGFGYRVFDQYRDVPLGWGQAERRWVARVVAFRGTDLGLADVLYGTLRDDQIDIAMKYFNREREREDAQHVPHWIVTGHSLGGALATEVSAKYDDVTAWMFNTSPFFGTEAAKNDSSRTIINERGDWLAFFRKYKAVPAANMFVLNCSPQEGGLTNHRIRRLSDCLIWIAAYKDEVAHQFIKDHSGEKIPITKPPVECGPTDKPHPGVNARSIEPCIHIARPKDQRDDPAE